jgi:hypothetical protein
VATRRRLNYDPMYARPQLTLIQGGRPDQPATEVHLIDHRCR